MLTWHSHHHSANQQRMHSSPHLPVPCRVNPGPRTLDARCREKFRGPLLACVEAPGGAVLLARALPVVAEMPACDLPTTAQDCLYPALAWQARAARVGVHRVLQAAPWLKASPVDFFLGWWSLGRAQLNGYVSCKTFRGTAAPVSHHRTMQVQAPDAPGAVQSSLEGWAEQ